VSSTNFHPHRKAVTPSLNLQCLYGSAALDYDFRSLPYFDNSGQFKLGCVKGTNEFKDLVRFENPHQKGEQLAIIPDQR